jgi:hypothetical protein
MKFSRATLLGGSTSCARAMLGKSTDNVTNRNRIVGRELEIERNIFKCLSSRVSVLQNRTKAHASSFYFDLRDPGLPLLPGIASGNQEG